MNIPHASIVFDWHEAKPITADLLNGGGRATEIVRHAGIVSFTCLKSFAQRHEHKDLHDLVYCLEHYAGEIDAVHARFITALKGKHQTVIRDALARLTVRFCDPNPDENFLRDGPVAATRFEDDSEAAGDEELLNRRILRQRRAAELMSAFLAPSQ